MHLCIRRDMHRCLHKLSRNVYNLLLNVACFHSIGPFCLSVNLIRPFFCIWCENNWPWLVSTLQICMLLLGANAWLLRYLCYNLSTFNAVLYGIHPAFGCSLVNLLFLTFTKSFNWRQVDVFQHQCHFVFLTSWVCDLKIDFSFHFGVFLIWLWVAYFLFTFSHKYRRFLE